MSAKRKNGLVSLYNDLFDKDYTSLQAWQVIAGMYCLDREADNYEKDIDILKFRYGVGSYGTGSTIKECAKKFNLSESDINNSLFHSMSRLHSHLYTDIMSKKGYLEIYVATKQVKKAIERRDKTIGAMLDLKFCCIFKDITGYANYNNGDINLKDYTPLGPRAIVCMERQCGITTCRELLDNERMIVYNDIEGIGRHTKEEILSYIKKLRAYDDWYNENYWRIDQMAEEV